MRLCEVRTQLTKRKIIGEVHRFVPRIDFSQARERYRKWLAPKDEPAGGQVPTAPPEDVITLGGGVGEVLDNRAKVFLHRQRNFFIDKGISSLTMDDAAKRTRRGLR